MPEIQSQIADTAAAMAAIQQRLQNQTLVNERTAASLERILGLLEKLQEDRTTERRAEKQPMKSPSSPMILTPKSESEPLTTCLDVTVESVESASTEIELASIDVKDKSDSAIATGVFEDRDVISYNVSSYTTQVAAANIYTDHDTSVDMVFPGLQPKVTVDPYEVFSYSLDSRIAVVDWNEERICESLFGVVKNILKPRLTPVCENDSKNVPCLIFTKMAFVGNWCYIQPLVIAAKPPAKPPEDGCSKSFDCIKFDSSAILDIKSQNWASIVGVIVHYDGLVVILKLMGKLENITIFLKKMHDDAEGLLKFKTDSNPYILRKVGCVDNGKMMYELLTAGHFSESYSCLYRNVKLDCSALGIQFMDKEISVWVLHKLVVNAFKFLTTWVLSADHVVCLRNLVAEYLTLLVKSDSSTAVKSAFVSTEWTAVVVNQEHDDKFDLLTAIVEDSKDDDFNSDINHDTTLGESLVVGVTVIKVTSNMFLADFSSGLVLNQAEFREWRIETQFYALKGTLRSLLPTVCGKVKMSLLSLLVGVTNLIKSWCSVFMKPPAQPPDKSLNILHGLSKLKTGDRLWFFDSPRDDVFIISCSDKFLRLTLQLLSRDSNWLSSGLSARKTGNINSGTGSEWATSAAADDFIYILHDLNRLKLDISSDYMQLVQQCLSSCLSNTIDLIKQSILEGAKSLNTLVHDVIETVVRALFEKSVEYLKHIKGISATYRMTNKLIPSRHSHSNYVSGVLRPLKIYLEGQLAEKYQSKEMKSDLLQRAAVQITDCYYELAEDVISVARKTETSLMKLRQGAQKRNAAVGGNNTDAADSKVSTDKTRMQLFLDIQEYGRNLYALGVKAAEIPSYILLWKCVAPSDKQDKLVMARIDVTANNVLITLTKSSWMEYIALKRMSLLLASFYQGMRILGDKVEKVVVLDRIVNLLYCVIMDEYGWAKDMRIIKALALRDSSLVVYLSNKKTIVIHPEKSIEEGPRKRFDADKDFVMLLFGSVLVPLQLDFCSDDLNTFGNKSHKMHKFGLTIDDGDGREEFSNALIVHGMLHDEVTGSVWLPRFVNSIFMFSLPRPPEIIDLEDKVQFKGDGMIQAKTWAKSRARVNAEL